MPRWIWFAPLSLIVLIGAAQGFRLGWIAAHLTESDAIAAYADRYVRAAGPGAAPDDCVAHPGASVWLVITCRNGERVWEYRVNRFGGLVGGHAPDPHEPRAQAKGRQADAVQVQQL
ncbi:hypothetical protein VK792_01860 [Mesobacterium sp. TK19101]|uniref:Uncharacterized protein n=1 Tax=Mesobacterium hydrothermale TaxID=3111907 RepID=A0ABU6HEY7_9RHOB|nr:hypothetical protein [Mesobacterium sp. TK19101]MEC3860018.1 hypothetical protein [Mesobacterium sp. TK19101]